MPKFYKQNKKKIDPRYFLEETSTRGDLREDVFGFFKQPEDKDVEYGAAALAKALVDKGGNINAAWSEIEKSKASIFKDSWMQDPNDGEMLILTKFGKAVEAAAKKLNPTLQPSTNRNVQARLKAATDATTSGNIRVTRTGKQLPSR